MSRGSMRSASISSHSPGAGVGAGGSVSTRIRAEAGSARSAVAGSEATMTASPSTTPVTLPLVPTALETVATRSRSEIHSAMDVMSSVSPLSYRRSTESCPVVPTPMRSSSGSMKIPSNSPTQTEASRSASSPETTCRASTPERPLSPPVRTPPTVTATMFGLEDSHSTSAVTSLLDPSVR